MSRYIEYEPLMAELEKDESQFDKEAEEARNNPSAYTDGYADAMWSRANGIRDAMIEIHDAPTIDIVHCRECIYYDPPHVEDHGRRIEYKDLPREAFDELGTGLVNMSYGVNIGGRCCVDYNCGYAEDKRVYRAEDNFCRKGRRPLNSSEKPNNSKERSE